MDWVILVSWFGKCQLSKKVGGRHFEEGLYQALFPLASPAGMLLTKWHKNRAWSFVVDRKCIIIVVSWYIWTLLSSHLVQTVSFLVFVILWFKQCTNVTHSQLQQCCSAHTLVNTYSSPSKIYFNWLLDALWTYDKL